LHVVLIQYLASESGDLGLQVVHAAAAAEVRYVHRDGAGDVDLLRGEAGLVERVYQRDELHLLVSFGGDDNGTAAFGSRAVDPGDVLESGRSRVLAAATAKMPYIHLHRIRR